MFLNAFLFFLLTYHILWVAFQLLIHRGLIHQQFIVDYRLRVVLRFILWLMYGLAFKNWESHITAQHRLHHLFSDQEKDPYSPNNYKFLEMFDYNHMSPGRPYYTSPEDIKKYSRDIKDDNSNLEINFYQKYPKLGLNILWGIYILLFGFAGLIIGAIHRFFINEIVIITANYATHRVGFKYAQRSDGDDAVIVFPIGILMAGEELHTNHHQYPNKINYAVRWFEFDICYWYIKFFELLKLIKLPKNNKIK
jgi:stearoyl-CoA desaturase (Delta-9 desaturase)